MSKVTVYPEQHVVNNNPLLFVSPCEHETCSRRLNRVVPRYWENFRHIRQARGLSQETVARLLNITRGGNLSARELHETDVPKPANIRKHAEALGCTTADLLRDVVTEYDVLRGTVQPHEQPKELTSDSAQRASEASHVGSSTATPRLLTDHSEALEELVQLAAEVSHFHQYIDNYIAEHRDPGPTDTSPAPPAEQSHAVARLGAPLHGKGVRRPHRKNAG